MPHHLKKIVMNGALFYFVLKFIKVITQYGFTIGYFKQGIGQKGSVRAIFVYRARAKATVPSHKCGYPLLGKGFKISRVLGSRIKIHMGMGIYKARSQALPVKVNSRVVSNDGLTFTDFFYAITLY